jgi:hypothetical protein
MKHIQQAVCVMGLLGVFASAVANKPASEPFIPLEQRNLIPILNRGKEAYLVNFRSIAFGDGQVPRGAGYMFYNNYFYDRHVKDTYNAVLDAIEGRTASQIDSLLRHDKQMQTLMAKPHWNAEDRNFYDKTISKIISREVETVKGLDTYRSYQSALGQFLKGKKSYATAEQNIKYLNELSSDIEAGTHAKRFDCGPMTLTEGIVRQRIEDKYNFLSKTAPQGDYKKSSAFWHATGGASSRSGKYSNHAFMITPAMQVVDGEGDHWNPDFIFLRVVNQTTLEQFAAGKPLILDNGVVYGGTFNDISPHQAARSEFFEVQAGRSEVGVNYTLDQLKERGRIPGNSIMVTNTVDSVQKNIVMLATRSQDHGQERFEIKAYKIHDVGTNQESYSMIGYKEGRLPVGTKSAALSLTVKNEGGQLKFDAGFATGGAKLDIYQKAPEGMPVLARAGQDGFTSINPISETLQAEDLFGMR